MRSQTNSHKRHPENTMTQEQDTTCTVAGVGVMIIATQGSEVLETPQMSLKAGLRTFGTDGMKAVEKEMKQLHDRDVMIPVHKKSLTPEQRREALAYLMFLKRKRCGKIKGCRCADGRKHRAYIAKEDSTAPTVSTEAVDTIPTRIG